MVMNSVETLRVLTSHILTRFAFCIIDWSIAGNLNTALALPIGLLFLVTSFISAGCIVVIEIVLTTVVKVTSVVA
jgi:hypothetical protein